MFALLQQGQETSTSPWEPREKDPGLAARMRLGLGGSRWERGPRGCFPTPSDLSQTLLLEKLRVARRPANEATFNVFYYLLACPDSALR